MPFQLTDYIPWTGSVITEAIVVVIMLRQQLVRRFPFFFASLAYDLARQVALAAILSRSLKAYSCAYWISIPAEYTIAFGVMLEAFRHLLRTNHKLPPKALRSLFIATVLLVGLATFLVIHPDIPTDNLTGMILTLDRSLELLRCGVLLFMWSSAAGLGLSWKHHVWGIVFGLGMYSGVSLIVAALHATTGTMCGDWLARVPHFSYFATTIIWAIYLWKPEPERGPLTLQELSFFNELIARYRKMISGIRRSFRDGKP